MQGLVFSIYTGKRKSERERDDAAVRRIEGFEMRIAECLNSFKGQ
jgi:hypothetical protein